MVIMQKPMGRMGLRECELVSRRNQLEREGERGRPRAQQDGQERRGGAAGAAGAAQFVAESDCLENVPQEGRKKEDRTKDRRQKTGSRKGRDVGSCQGNG